MTDPRAIAVNLITEWEEKNTFPNLALKSALRAVSDDRDRRFISTLVYGVVERKITLDHFIASCSNQPLRRVSPYIRAVLRIGIYQMFYLDIPDSAACDTAVTLVNKSRLAHSSGFVNAILRRCAREKETLLALKKADFSVRYSISPELVDLLLEQYGKERFVSIMEEISSPDRSVFLFHNTKRGDEESFLQRMNQEGVSLQETEVLHLYRSASGFSIENSNAYRDGWFHVVGIHSAETALLMPNQSKPIDLCAAPGGKTFIMATRTDRTIRSCDIHPHKVELLKQSALRLGHDHVQPLCNDASTLNAEWIESADFVLCDVPCSGLGIMGKKPDIKYKKYNSDDLVRIQYQILKNGAAYLQRQSRLVYSTCTLDRRENEEQIERFLKEFPNFCLDLKAIPNGMITHFPKDGADGFFIAVLKKG